MMTRNRKKDASSSSNDINSRVDQLEGQLEAGIEELKNQLSNSSKTPDDVSSFTTKLNEFANSIKQGINSIKNEISNLQTVAKKLDKMVEGERQERLLNGLVINGIPEADKENLEEIVCKFLKTKIKADVSLADINYCHRMGKNGSQQKSRPIAVQFVNRWMRDTIFRAKKILKGSPVVISEMLTQNKLDLYKKVRVKVGVKSCWTWRSKIYVFVNNNKKQIMSEEDLVD